MGLESIFDKQSNLEVGPSDSPPVPIPGVTPMQVSTQRKGTVPGDMLDYIRKQVKQAETDVVTPWRDRAITCYRFRDNNQLDDITRQELKAARRPDTAFNQLQKYIRYVAGNERRSPQALLFNPNVIDNEQQQILGGFLTDTYQWAVQKCFAASTIVRSGPFRGSYERMYEGDVVHLKLANGKDLTGTPNHPILTKVGWKPLGELRKGDDVVDDGILKRIPALAQYFQHVPTPIQNLARSVKGRLMAGVAGFAADDFHGDISDGDIYVVRSNRLEGNSSDIPTLQQVINAMLVIGATQANARRLAFLAKCLFLLRSLPNAHASTIGGDFRLHIPASLGGITHGVTGASETVTNGSGAEFDDVTDLIQGFSLREIQIMQLIGRHIGIASSSALHLARSESESGFGQSETDGTGAHLEAYADTDTRKILLEIESGQLLSGNLREMLSTTTVTETTRLHDRLPVYNLETDCGFYLAGSLVVHNCMGNFERSRAFEDLLTGGMGWTNTYIDKLRDPRGMVRHVRFSPFEALWPQCGDENLQTTRWRARESYIDVEDCLRRWADKRMLILSRSQGRDSGTDGANPFSPQQDFTRYTIYPIDTVPVDKSGRAETSKKGKCKVLEFQWYDDEDGFAFPDPVTGEPVWMSEAEFRKYHRKLEVLLPEIGAVLKQRSDKVVHRVCRVMHVLDRQFALDEPRRLPGDRFTLNCMTGHYDEDMKLWYGYVQILMDPQRYANKFFNQVIEIMGTSAKSGVTAQSDAFDETATLKDFQQNYAQAGSISIVAPEALEKGKVLPKVPAQLPQGAMAIVEFCVQSMSAVSGFDTAGIGLDAGGAQQPGITMQQKQGVARVMLAQEFDSLSRYRIEDEGPVIVAHLALIADGRFIRIGGPEAQQVVPLLREPFLLETELQLDDSEPDPTQRAKFQNFITQVGPMLAKLGLFVPSMFNYLPLPWKVRREMVQSMQAQKQKSEQDAAMGINTKGRGAPRTPQEVQAKVADMQARATMHQARAKAMLAESRREDLRTVIDTIQGFQRTGMERDRLSLEEQRHTLDQQRHGLDHSKHRLDHGKAMADTAIRLLEAMKPEPQPGGREE